MRRALLLALLGAAGCSGSDACKGIQDTCLSLTLLGSDAVGEVDQLQIFINEGATPRAMSMASAQSLPVKVAVLWPDGGATISVRSFLQGKLNGVTAKAAMELRGGAHKADVLTLYPPTVGPAPLDLKGLDLMRPADMTLPPDMTAPVQDMTAPVQDMTMGPVDMAAPDMAMGPVDMIMGPVDMAMGPVDMAAPADMPMMGDL